MIRTAMPLLVLLASAGLAADRPDVVVADFEGATYGDGWKSTGTAFGAAPARGTLPGQMPVSGYQGKGLVNSFLGGDASTGTLTSPEFTLTRRYLRFLIGGGGYPGKTCVDLLVADKVVRTATGPNTRPGGSEQLSLTGWDVSEFAGKKATLRIVDAATGGWGHINLDHIVLTDTRPPQDTLDAERSLALDKRYLEFPVKTGAARRRLAVRIDGRVWREFEIELADGKPDWWALLDVGAVQGKKAILRVDRLAEGSRGLAAVTSTDTPREQKNLYHEKHRPQFHFTSRRGWLNDPNGLVFHAGKWHLFYQHNPYGWSWGNMHWGHAVSNDLVCWEELPIALYPKRFGDWAFSGSAVVDRNNTAGFRKGDEEVLVLAFTSTGRGECIAFSNDHGQTWQEYPGNPVVRHQGRDPKLLWHAPSKRWVMAVYDEHAGKRWIAFFTSPDLKKWTFASRIEGFYECPDLFELPVAGRKDPLWVLYAADGRYVLGNFDGKAFRVTSGKHQLWHGNFYAAQTFSDTPEGRRVQIGWGQGITFPGMPFNQQMTFPCELSLRPTPKGPRMFAWPVREIRELYRKETVRRDLHLNPGENPLAAASGELFDLEAEFTAARGEAFGLRIRGVEIGHDVKKQELVCPAGRIPLKPVDGKVRLRVLVDRGSIEVFANDGAVAVSVGTRFTEKDHSLAVFTRGGTVRLPRLEVRELRSAWSAR